MTFLHPHILYLLLLLPIAIAWYLYYGRGRNQATLLTPSQTLLRGVPSGWRVYARHLLFSLRLLALACIIIALARPQSNRSWSENDMEGIDVMLTMDISTSMLAMDFQPNRLEAAKLAAIKFVNQRPTDNIGLVVFAAESFTACPLTTDHASLINRLQATQTGIVDDGTAIGLGLTTAINRLKDSPTKSKVIILLSDGVNNRGDISPQMAADLANPYGIVIHTIGVGSNTGFAPVALPSLFGSAVTNMPIELDEKTMTEIAEKSGGKYFRATDNKSLDKVYREIDKLEKSRISTHHYLVTSEWFQPFLLIALALLLVEYLLRHTWLRTRP